MTVLQFERERFQVGGTLPLPWGEGGGEGVKAV
jgi:hypothetical protein